MGLLQVNLACAFALVVLLTGCVKRTIEVRVHDPGRVGVSALGVRGTVPVLPPDGVDHSAPLAEDAIVVRERHQVVVYRPQRGDLISLVDPFGLLPPEKADRGFVRRGGWLDATYYLDGTRVLPEGDPPGNSIPIVLTTPVDNVAGAMEVREPRRWPAYVFLPVGGTFTFLGASLLASSGTDETDVGVFYLVSGIPLLVYGIVNAVASSESVPVALP
jgi:hypothetical protein